MARTRKQDLAAMRKAAAEGYPDLPDDTQVEIAHEDGRAYGVSLGAFRELYMDAGFTLTRRADNAPLPLQELEAAQAAEDEASAATPEETPESPELTPLPAE